MALECARRARKSGVEVIAISHRREIKEQLSSVIGCHTATIQSVARVKEQLALFSRIFVIIDECHHYQAPEWSSLFDIYPKAWFMGFTATPHPHLGNVFDELVVAADYPQLVREGHLCKVRLIRPGEFLGKDLGMNPVKAYQKYTPGERAFLFSSTIEQSKYWSEEFNNNAIASAHVDATTPEGDRKISLDLFRKWGVKVICNVQILTEGIDVPEASCCILTSHPSNCSSYLQKVGRVLRPHETKDWATLLDLPGSSWIYGSPIEQRKYSLTEGVSLARELGVRDCPQCAWAGGLVAVCPKCGWEFHKNKKKNKGRIYDAELLETWCGSETPKEQKEKEWLRLLLLASTRGYSLYWATSKYKGLFDELPELTRDQKRKLYERELDECHKRGYKPGRAYFRYRKLLGENPE